MAFETKFIPEHWKKFRCCNTPKLERNKKRGKFPETFAQDFYNANSEQLCRKTVDHDYVVGCVEDPTKNVATVCAAILAWGGMRYPHRNDLISLKSDCWLKVSQKLRCGEIGHLEAFEEFTALRKGGLLKGMGPAYFTKLIYFLQFSDSSKGPGGYIMDQWASETVNLLTDTDTVLLDANVSRRWKKLKRNEEPVVVVSANSRVSDLNTSENYRKFCSAMDEMASELNMNRSEIDCAVMGQGDNANNNWRYYLVEQRKKALVKKLGAVNTPQLTTNDSLLGI